MDLSVIGPLFDVIGTLMIAFAALRVHHRVLNEHSIDDQVFTVMRREQFIGVIGVCFVIASFALHMVEKFL